MKKSRQSRISKVGATAALICLSFLLSACVARTGDSGGWYALHFHDWKDADCVTAKTCRICGETSGEPMGHAWRMGTAFIVKTCERCDATKSFEDSEVLSSDLPYTDRREGQIKIRRSMLNDCEKELYDQFLPYVLSYTPFTIDCTEKDYKLQSFYKAFDAIRLDYPETWLYFSDEAIDRDLTTWDEEEETFTVLSYGSVYFNLDYFKVFEEKFNAKYVSNYIKKVDNKCEEILATMPQGLSTREQYVWLADYLCDTTEYYDYHKYRYADGPLLYGKGICQSYAYAYQWLCQKAGLWNITCGGMAGGEGHAWNVVMLDDGQTYYMDVTWADGSSNRSKYYFMTYEECTRQRDIDEGEWIADGK